MSKKKKTFIKCCKFVEMFKNQQVYFSALFLTFLAALMLIQIICQNMVVSIDKEIVIDSTLVSVNESIPATKYLAVCSKNNDKKIHLIEELYDTILTENSIEDVSEEEFLKRQPTLFADKYTLIDLTSSIEVELDIDIDMDEVHTLAAPQVDSGFVYYTTYRDYDNGNTKALPMSEAGQKIVYNTAKKYGLPYKTVLALLGVETHWNEDPDHIERGIYIGIGCVNKNYHAKKFADRGIDIYTLEGNIEAICYLLRESRDLFNGSMTYAIMGYNGGNGYAGSQRSDGITETSYTKKVAWYAESFR